MSSISPITPSVNASPFTPPPVVPFAHTPNVPEPMGKVRDPRGRFALVQAPGAVRQVFLPHTWVFAHQVGGQLFANREAAIRVAKAREAKAARVLAARVQAAREIAANPSSN